MNVVGEIKWYLGNDYALLKYSQDNFSISIDTIMVPALFRNKGIGTSMINQVLAMADGLGKTVRISARPVGEVSEERLLRLVAYYERFNFKMHDRGMTIAYMVREIPVREGETPDQNYYLDRVADCVETADAE